MPVVHRNGSRCGGEPGRRKKTCAEVPLSPTLPENVAVQWVIFITNEINNATICTQLSPGGLHQLTQRILRCYNSENRGGMVEQPDIRERTIAQINGKRTRTKE